MKPQRQKPFERIVLRNFGNKHFLEAIWHKNVFVGHLEYGTDDKDNITKIFALVLAPRMRGRGYGERIMLEIVKNSNVRLYSVEPSAKGFWRRFVNNPRNNKMPRNTPNLL